MKTAPFFVVSGSSFVGARTWRARFVYMGRLVASKDRELFYRLAAIL